MLTVPTTLKRQLAASIALVAESDFPAKWPTLLPELVAKLGTSDSVGVNGVLSSLHSITKRYVHVHVRVLVPPIVSVA
jgi:exportin-2 (importin alpha re-exporter)